MFNAITWALPKIFADCRGHFGVRFVFFRRRWTSFTLLQFRQVTANSSWRMCKFVHFSNIVLHQGSVDRFHEIAADKTRVIGWAPSRDYRILRFLHIC